MQQAGTAPSTATISQASSALPSLPKLVHRAASQKTAANATPSDPSDRFLRWSIYSKDRVAQEDFSDALEEAYDVLPATLRLREKDPQLGKCRSVLTDRGPAIDD